MQKQISSPPNLLSRIKAAWSAFQSSSPAQVSDCDCGPSCGPNSAPNSVTITGLNEPIAAVRFRANLNGKMCMVEPMHVPFPGHLAVRGIGGASLSMGIIGEEDVDADDVENFRSTLRVLSGRAIN
jgi:hypothetical protein